MAEKKEHLAAPIEARLIGTRELITDRETAYKSRQTERDQETFNMVKEKNLTDTKFAWSAAYENGKVRVSIVPRA